MPPVGVSADPGDRVSGRGLEDPLSADLGLEDDACGTVDGPSDDRRILSFGSGTEGLQDLFRHLGHDGQDALSLVTDVEGFDTEEFACVLHSVTDGDIRFIYVELAL